MVLAGVILISLLFVVYTLVRYFEAVVRPETGDSPTSDGR